MDEAMMLSFIDATALYMAYNKQLQVMLSNAPSQLY